MHGKVLDRGNGLEIGRVVTLQALDELHGQPAGQERIFPIGLLSPAPARITEDVDVRRPEGQALIDEPLAVAHELMVLGPGLIGYGG